ncbi:hypothetical protein [Natrinema pallidum]|uniref:Uncharacterized protein n=1 Tax=Natrinema pallidum DSM 3751 TaxID=1227495 RepID=L9Z000_9EURY|nr:hypothetical protein [Natrinema pallidum]ELY79002.1 hypothetical protein C487_07240 [Natrinema pallidum DSM 3751]
MSTDPTATAVLEEVEADPDAILAAFDADSPADLVDAGGDHDPRPDDAVDTTATDLFADLAAGETAATNGTDGEPPAANATDADSDGMGRATDADGGAPTRADREFEFVGHPDMIIRGDGDVIDATAVELGALVATDVVAADSTDPADCVDPRAAPDTDSTDATASSRTLTIRDGRTERLALVGPEPTRTRIADDVFGGVRVDTH